MSDVLTAISTPRWDLRHQKRFRVGDARRRIAVIEVYDGWLEMEFENEDGRPVHPRNFIAIPMDVLLPSIVEEIEPVSRREAEERGYR